MNLERTEKLLNDFAERVIELAQKNLSSKGKSGNLSKTLSYHLKLHKSGALDMDFLSAGYGTFVDKGVSGTERKYNTPYAYKTKQPPSSALDKWVVRKGLTGTRDSKGRFVPRKSITFLIARSIKRYGIKPTNFFTNAFEEAFKDLPDDFTRKYGEDVIKFLQFATKEF
jgi:hypothetical protein|tara:strand:- start:21 stop:527 length:507 start_codon:yes stop_codon:yes gene_type:complete